MSEHEQDQKTEEPTPKQKDRFRERGEVARSQDLASVVSIAGGLGAIAFAWGLIGSAIVGFASLSLSHLERHSQSLLFGGEAVKTVISVIAPVALTGLVLGIAAQIAQVGWKPSAKPLTPNFTKMNPLPRFKQLFFSGSTAIELAKSVVKVIVIGLLAVRVLWDEVAANGRMISLRPVEVMGRLAEISVRIVLTVIIALAFIAVIDILIERFRHNRKMKMTKEEVKREHKDTDGDPLVKGRQRGRARELVRSRMLDSVKTADVVVVNPTHYSVALRYKMATDPAPMIVAAGVDNLAAKIRKLARQNSVPVVSDPPLARALYYQGKVGKAIPAELFRAVASLLAWVYNVTGRIA